jgi:hypothetical protein
VAATTSGTKYFADGNFIIVHLETIPNFFPCVCDCERINNQNANEAGNSPRDVKDRMTAEKEQTNKMTIKDGMTSLKKMQKKNVYWSKSVKVFSDAGLFCSNPSNP